MRRFRRPLAAISTALVGATVYAIVATAAPIPVPNPVVVVTTKSGDVVRESLVPIGGVPVPIDVDDAAVTGILTPDIDVSVGVIAVDELPDRIVVPNIQIRRNALAIARSLPAPPLDIDLKIEVRDANDLLGDPIAEIHYGYETPVGAVIPPYVRAKVVGPIQTGFTDPLEAYLDVPGYSGPLNFEVDIITPDLRGDFDLAFDSMPEQIHFVQDPRNDGLDVLYEHIAPVADVHLSAFAALRNRNTNQLLEIGAEIERLPQRIELHNTSTKLLTTLDYKSSSALSKPDLSARYTDTAGDGTTTVDADLKVSGLPFAMRARLDSVEGDEPDTTEIDKLDFQILDGEQIDAVEFLARNFVGDPGPIPELELDPAAHVAVAARQMPDATTRWRAAGRIEGIRRVTVERQGADDQTLDVRTDLGGGTESLRAVLDIDNRGPGGPTDPDKRLRMKVDASVIPLPREIHVNFDPSAGSEPTKILYESGQTSDIVADVLIAQADAFDGCGQSEVTCLKARIDKLPERLEASLPGEGGKDFSISHSGAAGTRPDVRAIVDSTPADPDDRTYAEVGLLRVPTEVRGRLDISTKDVLKKAEFHGCTWDFAANGCTDAQQALGRVTFTVRDHPSRAGLPALPDTAPAFVSLIARDPIFATEGEERFEATGRVDEVRNVAFHQRDDDDDGEADGTLGVNVDVGVPGASFDAVIDTQGFTSDPANEAINLGQSKADITVHVDELPTSFDACVRSSSEDAPPDPGSLSPDPLLAACDRTDVLGRAAGALTLTPMTVFYDASTPTEVTGKVKTTAPDAEDRVPITNVARPHTTVFDATIRKVPAQIRADVISPQTPEPDALPPVAGRKLEIGYAAKDANGAPAPISRIFLDALETRRTKSICGDPRPDQEATCLNATLKDLPSRINVTFDPDESKGDIDFNTAPPVGAQPKLSIDPIHLDTVSPDPESQPLVLDAQVLGITPHLTGKFVSQHTAQDPPGETSLTQLSFNACPDGPCGGIDKIIFTATNALVGDPLDDPPAPDPDTTQDFSFVQRGDPFEAKGSIGKLKEIGLSRRDAAGNPSATTKVRAAFGDGTSAEKLRAFIDRITVTDPENNSGLEEQVVHAVISDAPKAINACVRDKLAAGELPAPPGSATADFCEKAPASKLAVQTRLDSAAGGVKPDIDIRKLRLAKAGGTDFLEGTLFIRDLAERIDVLAGKGAETDVLVEGHDISDPPGADPKNVAARVKFNLRNYVGTDAGTGQFPFVSLSGAVDPQNDTRVDEGAEENFAKVIKDDESLLLKGSIPEIKRVSLRPGPCDAVDTVRFPPAASYPDADSRPAYTCVNFIAAQNHPLGLAIRTKDNKGEILALDEGFISSVPGGAGGIFATITKSPDKAKLNPVCGVDGATAVQGCRPPLISVKAPKAAGQTSRLEARLAVGPQPLVQTLRDTTPVDLFSQRLNYEQPVKDYAKRGARLKLGTKGEDTAVRVGLSLDLPNFLDLDPPSSFSCKRDDLSGGVLDPDSAACKQTDVTSRDNNGYESKDIGIRMVGANSGHLGTDVASLGRAAILIQDMDKGKQTILTGAFPPPANNHGAVDDSPTGSHPEADPPTGDHDLGLDLPGYLDARVYGRDKFEAPGEDDMQTSFIQVDGRVNSPLSLTLRDVHSEGVDREDYQPGLTRSGKTVAALSLGVRNAPGLGAGAPNFVKPTFRVRAEMRKKHVEPAVGPYDCLGFNGGGGRTAGFGANFCIWAPGDHLEKWLDVGVNMNPDQGSAPARTVDVVTDNEDYTQIDMRASSAINGSGGDVGKGSDAAFTPQAGLRLQPFPIGLEVGLGLGIVGGNTLLMLDGDLILKLTSKEPSRLRLSQNVGAMRLLAESAGAETPNPAATVKTHDQTVAIVQVRAEALFGLISENVVDVRTDPYHQTIQFKKCAFPNIGIFTGSDDYFAVDRDDSTKTAIVLPPGDIPAEAAAANVLTAVSEILAPIWCLLSTEDNNLVTSTHPAPVYIEPGRPIDDTDEAVVPTPPTPPTPVLTPVDLTIESGETITLCGSKAYRTVLVKNGGTLLVGKEGTSITDTFDPDGVGGQPAIQTVTSCNGSLLLTADQVTVDAGGFIDANARRTTAGPGAGTGGAGASHSGTGGDSDAGAPGATYGIGSNPLTDFGSRGGNAATGGALGGDGGGTLDIRTVNFIDVKGTIRANGAGGGSNGADCNVDGGGGGSGGAVKLTSNIIAVPGSVQARGGPGGNGGDAGGGGGGGRITVNTVDPRPGNLSVSGGSAGAAGAAAGCAPATASTAGNNTLGDTINHAAGVTFDSASEPQAFVKGSVPLKVRGVRNGGGPLKVLVCRRTVTPLTDPEGLEDTGLDPPGGSLQSVIDNSNCTTESFAAPTSGGNLYERSITRSLVDGFHGFFAIAAVPSGLNLGANCRNVGSFPLFGDGCTYQATVPGGTLVLPGQSTVKVASDNTAPTVSFSNQSGTAGCAGGRLCTNQAGTMTVTSADNAGGIGIDSVLCSINGGSFDVPCGPSDKVVIDFGTVEGNNDLQIRTIDRLGNQATITGPKWFVDRNAGNTPTIALNPGAAAPINGWYKVKPTVTVHAEDSGAGFDPQPVTFFTDTSSFTCGALSGGDLVADCSAVETAPFVPAEGIHTFQALSTDKLGNQSLKSSVVTMKVDKTPPDVEIFLGPKKPDGLADWYVTKPFVAFGAVDNVGGSGVSLTHPSGVSKIEWKVDGGSFSNWSATAANELDDGIHTVCFRATDLANNTSPQECKGNIKVDTTVPTVSDAIAPPAPDGDNSFYVAKPTVDPAGTDFAHPLGSSTLDRVQMKLDDGPWVGASSTEIQEGEHVLLVRAFDKAGNRSLIGERVVRADVSKPSLASGTYPPAPNARGWYRQRPFVSLAASDGRDASGPGGVTFTLDGGGPAGYQRPFRLVDDGPHVLVATPQDRAGNHGDAITRNVRTDTRAPFATPKGASGSVILSAIAILNQTAQLKFHAGDALGEKVRVIVQVYNETGLIVRHLAAAGDATGYRAAGAGAVTWNGRNDANRGVLPGLYHYRVLVIDEAGNTVVSTESKWFPVVLGVVPL